MVVIVPSEEAAVGEGGTVRRLHISSLLFDADASPQYMSDSCTGLVLIYLLRVIKSELLQHTW